MKLIAKLVLITFILYIVQVALMADHLPPSETARGRPEHVLSGINVYTDNIVAVIKRLGKPENYTDVPLADGPAGSGERTYNWIRDGVRLRVGTQYHTGRSPIGVIESPPMIVDVWGPRTVQMIGSTGTGLSLGDKIAKIKRLYGSHFHEDTGAVTLEWKDETTLIVDFDSGGAVKHMQLMAAVE
jgi:hypothetical protein